MFNELNDVIDQLEDKERKALLSQIFLRMQVVEERNGYSEEQFFLDIKNTYNNLLEYKKINVFDLEGVPKAMRNYSIKILRNNQTKKMLSQIRQSIFFDCTRIYKIKPNYELPPFIRHSSNLFKPYS